MEKTDAIIQIIAGLIISFVWIQFKIEDKNAVMILCIVSGCLIGSGLYNLFKRRT